LEDRRAPRGYPAARRAAAAGAPRRWSPRRRGAGAPDGFAPVRPAAQPGRWAAPCRIPLEPTHSRCSWVVLTSTSVPRCPAAPHAHRARRPRREEAAPSRDPTYLIRRTQLQDTRMHVQEHGYMPQGRDSRPRSGRQLPSLQTMPETAVNPVAPTSNRSRGHEYVTCDLQTRAQACPVAASGSRRDTAAPSCYFG
jgi:hypothetical protein